MHKAPHSHHIKLTISIAFTHICMLRWSLHPHTLYLQYMCWYVTHIFNYIDLYICANSPQQLGTIVFHIWFNQFNTLNLSPAFYFYLFLSFSHFIHFIHLLAIVCHVYIKSFAILHHIMWVNDYILNIKQTDAKI